jgi:hypothetical protein
MSKAVTCAIVLVVAVFTAPQMEAVEESHELGSGTTFCFCGSGQSKSWDFTVENTMTLEEVEAAYRLTTASACPSDFTAYVTIRINGAVVADFEQYVNHSNLMTYTDSQAADLEINQGDDGSLTFTYSGVSGCIGGPNTVTLRGFTETVPIAGLTATNDGPTELGNPTTFTASITSGTGVSYFWDFGDGSSGSGAQTTYTYSTPGTHTATITATNSVSTETASTVVTVTGEPEGPIANPGAHVCVIPASAHVTGAAGTNWGSDVVAHNHGATTATVDLFFMKADQDNSGSQPHRVSIPPGQSLCLLDVVGDLFGETSGSGAILLGSDVPLIVSSRTFNTTAAGTYGQYIPGFPLAEAAAGTAELRLLQLSDNAAYRTNIGFANPTNAALPLEVSVYGGDGTLLGTQGFIIEPYGYSQANGIISDIVGNSNVNDAYAIVSSSDPQARYFAYASTVDNSSGDPVYMSGLTRRAGIQYVPAAAHVAGANHTLWRTDLEAMNPGQVEARFRLEVLPADSDNSTPMGQSHVVQAGQSVRYQDVLSLFNLEGSAALRIVPEAGEILVTSRTFNDVGSETYGQYVPAINDVEALTTEETARLVQLAYSPNPRSGYRTNIGFVSACDETVTIDLDLYTGSGSHLGLVQVVLPPYAYHQENAVFADFTSSPLDDAYAEVRSNSEGARYFAYASVVDNLSGDPVFIPSSRTAVATGDFDFSEDFSAGYDEWTIKNASATVVGGQLRLESTSTTFYAVAEYEFASTMAHPWMAQYDAAIASSPAGEGDIEFGPYIDIDDVGDFYISSMRLSLIKDPDSFDFDWIWLWFVPDVGFQWMPYDSSCFGVTSAIHTDGQMNTIEIIANPDESFTLRVNGQDLTTNNHAITLMEDQTSTDITLGVNSIECWADTATVTMWDNIYFDAEMVGARTVHVADPSAEELLSIVKRIHSGEDVTIKNLLQARLGR